jgi:hypothetical protein
VTDATAGHGRADRQRRRHGYRIFRDGVDGGPADGVVHATGLAPSTLYKFQAAAFDAAGNQSAKSAGLKLTTTAASSGGALNTTTPWSYSTTRSDPGPTWKDPGFVVPTDWKSGVPQLGFGDGDEATLDRGGSTSSSGSHLVLPGVVRRRTSPSTAWSPARSRDDGAAVYVNGSRCSATTCPEPCPSRRRLRPASAGRTRRTRSRSPFLEGACWARTSSRSSSTMPVRSTATPAQLTAAFS